MATQKSVEWQDLKIELGDGATPTEAFAAPCALRTRGIAFEAQTSEAALLDCETPETPGFMARNVTSKSAAVNGSGLLDPDDLDTWWLFFNNGTKKNIRAHVDVSLANGGGYWQGPYILTRFELTGERDSEGGLVAVTVEMQSAGDITWTDASS